MVLIEEWFLKLDYQTNVLTYRCFEVSYISQKWISDTAYCIIANVQLLCVLDLAHFNTSDLSTAVAGLHPAPNISVAHPLFAVVHSKEINSRWPTYIQEMAHCLATGKICLLKILSELFLFLSTYYENMYGALMHRWKGVVSFVLQPLLFWEKDALFPTGQEARWCLEPVWLWDQRAIDCIYKFLV